MIFRLGKPQDAKRLAQIRSEIKEVNNLGFFVLMGGRFLTEYYKLILEDPYSYCLVAENDEGVIVGYSFNLIDSEKNRSFIFSHKFRLAWAALGTVLRKPRLIGEIYKRYRSLKSNDGQYTSAKGARGGYWGWDPNYKNSEGALELRERMHAITQALGINIIHFEVDNDNKSVYKMHKMCGAILDEEITLPDGRKRSLMHYDERTRRRLMKIQ